MQITVLDVTDILIQGEKCWPISSEQNGGIIADVDFKYKFVNEKW